MPKASDQTGTRLEVDFSPIGPVTLHRIRFINVAFDSRNPRVVVRSPDAQIIEEREIPFTDQNGVVGLDFDSTENVGLISFLLDGDIALADMCFTPASEPSDPGCTRTIGYWKNQSGVRGQDIVSEHLPVKLGSPGGQKTLRVESAATAMDVLSQDVYGHPSNGIIKLYAQFLAAKLNISAGADSSPLGTSIVTTDLFLALHSHEDWDALTQNEQRDVLLLKDLFDRYNNGLEGVPHCD